MKNNKISLFCIFSLLMISFGLQAQKNNNDNGVSIGIKAGVSTTDVDPELLLLKDEDGLNKLSIAIKDANYGFHFGVFSQMRAGNFIFQPEVIFNSNDVDYTVTDVETSNVPAEIINQKYQYLDIPLMLGMKLGPLRLQAGPVGHVFINSSSELTDIESYKEDFESLTLGYQAGLGLDFWRFVIDFKYEGNFNNFGQEIHFGNNTYEFSQTPRRFVASIGIKF